MPVFEVEDGVAKTFVDAFLGLSAILNCVEVLACLGYTQTWDQTDKKCTGEAVI